jgi:hypothetical protein
LDIRFNYSKLHTRKSIHNILFNFNMLVEHNLKFPKEYEKDYIVIRKNIPLFDNNLHTHVSVQAKMAIC